jgi:hypothetical protein
MRKRIWDSIKGVWKEVTAEHPIHAAKRAVKDAKKAKDKADREAYKKKTKGPRNVLLKFPDTKGESSRTVSISNKQDKSKFYKKRSDPLAMKKGGDQFRAEQKAKKEAIEKKADKLKSNREKARSKKGSSMFTSPKARRQKEGLKKGMEKRTAHKKSKLQKSRYYIKHRDDKAVVYEWSDKAGKFVVKKGKPKKEGKPVTVPTNTKGHKSMTPKKWEERSKHGNKGLKRPSNPKELRPTKDLPKKMQPPKKKNNKKKKFPYK